MKVSEQEVHNEHLTLVEVGKDIEGDAERGDAQSWPKLFETGKKRSRSRGGSDPELLIPHVERRFISMCSPPRRCVRSKSNVPTAFSLRYGHGHVVSAYVSVSNILQRFQ